MHETLTIISLLFSIVSVTLIIGLNWYTLKKVKRENAKEREQEENRILGAKMENTVFGKQVIEKLNYITEMQSIYNQSLLHMLRADLLEVTDEIMYINRKRNTQSSKWFSLEARLNRYKVLEEVLDNCYISYKRLGGNCYIEERYKDCKSIIKMTQRKAEE